MTSQDVVKTAILDSEFSLKVSKPLKSNEKGIKTNTTTLE